MESTSTDTVYKSMTKTKRNIIQYLMANFLDDFGFHTARQREREKIRTRSVLEPREEKNYYVKEKFNKTNNKTISYARQNVMLVIGLILCCIWAGFFLVCGRHSFVNFVCCTYTFGFIFVFFSLLLIVYVLNDHRSVGEFDQFNLAILFVAYSI